MPSAADRVKAAFMAALDMDHADRPAVLDGLCGGDTAIRQRVEAMLRAHDRTDPLLDQPAAGHLSVGPAATSHPSSPAEEPGAVIAGRYHLREIIGEGGMGSVWLAEQTVPVRRTVAVKLIKIGMDTRQVVARFEAERQALALMDHPHIAKVLDGGTTATGRPFFVMEYVPGRPITDACAAERVDVAGRLRLFVQVCEAVQHAHQKGVIHRDLKPSNILVYRDNSGPVPKVIDFGLAKAVGQSLTENTLQTGPGVLLGTLRYMSPEQTEFDNPDIDTRADVYALGVILYELLTGTTPLQRQGSAKSPWPEMLRVIREEEPPRPSAGLSGSGSLPTPAGRRTPEPLRLTRQACRELDWIVMKALEKDRARRYDSAAAFGQDLQRLLAGEPVAAHPPSATYRVRKFVRRHRGSVVAAGVVLAALVAGVIGTTIGLIEARRQEEEARGQERIASDQRDAKEVARQKEAEQRALAEDRLAKLEKGVEILGAVFAKVDPKAVERGGDPVAVAIGKQLEQAVEELKGEAVGDPLVVARLQIILGNSLVAVGRPQKAVEVLEPAAATRAARLGEDDVDTLLARADLATAYSHAGQVPRSLEMFEAVEPALVRRLGATEPRVLKGRREHGAALIAARREREAVDLLIGVTNDYKAAGREEDRDALVAANMLAHAYLTGGRFEQAMDLLHRLIPDCERVLGVDHPDTLSARNNQAIAHRQAGRFGMALDIQQRVYERLRINIREDHSTMLAARYDLALSAGDAGKYADAVAILERFRDFYGKQGGSPALPHVRHQLGLAYVRAGEPYRGVVYIEWALQDWLARPATDGTDVRAAQVSLGIACAACGDLPKAIRIFDDFLEAVQTTGKQTPVQVLLARTHLADALRRAGQFARSSRLALEALQSAEDRLGPDHPTTLLCRDNLAAVYRAQGRTADAITLIEKNFPPAARMGPDHPEFLRYGLHLTVARMEGGDDKNARTLLERDVEQARGAVGETHPLTLAIVQTLADVLEREKTWDRAVAERQKVVDGERQRVERQKAKLPGRSDDVGRSSLAAAQVKLGQTLLAAGRFAVAEPPLREALEVLDREQATNWERFAARSMLGEALAGQKKYGDAEALLLEGHRGLNDRVGSIPQTPPQPLPRARERLAQLYEAWGKSAEAARWRADGAKK